MSYLSQLPIDRLKIDRSLIRGVTSRTRDAAIVRSIISLGRELGVTVIAEGVETEQQLQALRDVGCPQAQGFLLAAPTPIAEACVVMSRRWGGRYGGAPKSTLQPH